MLENYVPILIMFLLAAGFGIFVLIVSALLGPKRPYPVKQATYECGMDVEPDARRYPCEFCGNHSVYGLQEALLMDRVSVAFDGLL